MCWRWECGSARGRPLRSRMGGAGRGGSPVLGQVLGARALRGGGGTARQQQAQDSDRDGDSETTWAVHLILLVGSATERNASHTLRRWGHYGAGGEGCVEGVCCMRGRRRPACAPMARDRHRLTRAAIVAALWAENAPPEEGRHIRASPIG